MELFIKEDTNKSNNDRNNNNGLFVMWKKHNYGV